jgi:ketosteroid isomerase-like protein
MSDGNVEATLRDMIRAFNTGGVEAALPYFHPEIAWYAPPEWLEKSVYRGHDGLRELAASWEQNFDEYRLDVERVVDLSSGRALGLLYQRGRIRDSSRELEQHIAFIVRLQDGELVRVDVHFSWEAGLEAAGLRE